jgi:hypothetical protein
MGQNGEVSLDHLRTGAGIGLHTGTIIGPMRLEIRNHQYCHFERSEKSWFPSRLKDPSRACPEQDSSVTLFLRNGK